MLASTRSISKIASDPKGGKSVQSGKVNIARRRSGSCARGVCELALPSACATRIPRRSRRVRVRTRCRPPAHKLPNQYSRLDLHAKSTGQPERRCVTRKLNASAKCSGATSSRGHIRSLGRISRLGPQLAALRVSGSGVAARLGTWSTSATCSATPCKRATGPSCPRSQYSEAAHRMPHNCGWCYRAATAATYTSASA